MVQIPGILSEASTFPLWAIGADGACTCGNPACDSSGKHPNKFRARQSAAGYGVETGQVSGLFVLDVDTTKNTKTGEDGWDSLQKIALEHGSDTLKTFTVRTGSGGFHFYFRTPTDGRIIRNSTRKLAWGLDIKGEGGFVVGPNSPHRSGNAYSIANDSPIAPAPKWLADWSGLYRVVAPLETIGALGEAFEVEPIPEDGAECAERTERYRADLETMPASVSGENGHMALLRATIRGVRYYELSDDIVLTCLDEVFNPRCDPPWSEPELEHKVKSARFDSYIEPGCPPANWSETLERLKAKAQAPSGLRSKVPESVVFEDVEKPKRRTGDEPHEYTYEVGLEAAAMERKKYPLAFLTNTLLTHEAWSGVLQYNKFAEHLHAVRPPMPLDAETEGLSVEDVNAVRCWFETVGVACGFDDVKASIKLAARVNSYNPVIEYLDDLATDEPPDCTVLDTLATKWFGAEFNVENVFLKRWLIAAVRRAYDPGCKVDTTLVLQGSQGIGKSDFVTALFGEWYRDQMPDLSNNRDASHALEGFWAVEFGELDKMLRVDARTVKDFLTRRIDNYRAFGTGEKIARKRSTVFIGTTNEDDFLRDSTGERRFLPIAVKRVVPGAQVRAMRDDVWRAARFLALDGYVFGSDVQPDGVARHWFAKDEDLSAEVQATRERFALSDPWDDDVTAYLLGKETVSLNDVYLDAIAKNDPGALVKFDRKLQLRVANILRALGCTRVVAKVLGKAQRVWEVPTALATAAPPKRALTRVK